MPNKPRTPTSGAVIAPIGSMASMAMVIAALFATGPWLAAPVAAQESDAPAEAAPQETAQETAEETKDDATAAADELTEEEERLAEIVGADEEGASGDYGQEEEDDFVPTQEVSSDQSVNFPVDI